MTHLSTIPGPWPAYPAGEPFPGRDGYVTGICGHAVAASEWRAGFVTCEREHYDYGQLAAMTADLMARLKRAEDHIAADHDVLRLAWQASNTPGASREQIHAILTGTL